MVRKTVAFDEGLVRDLNILARKEQRDFSGAARYALRRGSLVGDRDKSRLTVEEIKNILEAKVDYEMGSVSTLNLKDV